MRDKIRVAINGFGRIGRTLTRLILADPHIELIAINDLYDPFTMGHLFKYDSINGKFKGEVSSDANGIQINERRIHFFQERDWTKLPWQDLAIDIVIDCSGQSKTFAQANDHLLAGAQRVMISAPADY